MKFQQIDERHYCCESDSGRIYHLTGQPIPDEFDSAMRCGISPDDPFVQAIPLIWSCNCQAGQHGRECKHCRALLHDVFAHGPTEAEYAMARRELASKRRSARDATDAARAADVERCQREAAAFQAAMYNPQCRAEAATMIDSGRDCSTVEQRDAFAQRWGFYPHETRIERLAGIR